MKLREEIKQNRRERETSCEVIHETVREATHNEATQNKLRGFFVFAIAFFALSFLFLNINSVLAATYFVSDPASCPTDAYSQTCVGGLKVCGVNSQSVVSCYNTGSLAAPAGAVSVSGGTVTAAGGYMADCYYYDGSAPNCDNGGAHFCYQKTACNNLAQVTTCTGGQWAASTCGGCKDGYHDCDGNSGNGCAGATEHDGVACTTGLGLPGTYSTCICVGLVLKLGSDSVSGATSVIQSTIAPALYISGYNVGIGTSVPNDTFSIGNSGAAPAGSLATGHNFTSTYLSADNYALTNYGVVKSLISTATSSITLWGGAVGGNIWSLNSGNVGIGTTNPWEKLYVVGADASSTISWVAGFKQNWNTASGDYGTGIKLRQGIATEDKWAGIAAVNDGAWGTSAMALYANKLERIRISSSGNVGIGTTAPTYKLDVEGTTSTSGIRSDIGLDFNPLLKPAAPTLALIGSAGNLGVGTYRYTISITTALGETDSPSTVLITTTSGSQQVNVSWTASTDYRATGYKIYRTALNGFDWETKLLTSIVGTSTASYVDNVADASLTGNLGMGTYHLNTTSKQFTINGNKAAFIDSKATLFGYQAGNALTYGGNLVLIGRNAGSKMTTATESVIVGDDSGSNFTTQGNQQLFGFNNLASVTSGTGNVAVGHRNLYKTLSANSNTTVGFDVLYGNGQSTTLTQNNNVAVGNQAGYNLTNVSYATLLGNRAGYGGTSGDYNVFLGNYAGYYETGSQKIIIDNLDRTTEALQRTNALIYGVTNITAANQILSLGGGGNVGIGTSVPNDTLSIGNSGAAPAGSLATGHNFTSTYLSTDNFALTNYGLVKSLISAATSTITLWGGTTGGNIWSLNSGNVGIGTSTPTSALHVLNTGTQLRLGYDASNYTNFSVDSAGHLTITPSATQSVGSGMTVNSSTGGGNSNYTGLSLNGYGYRTSAANTQQTRGIQSQAILLSVNNQNWTNALGLIGVDSDVVFQSGATGIIAGAANFYAGTTIPSGTLTNLYGVYIAAPIGAGTISNKYAFVSEPNAGNVGIGTTNPTEKLEVSARIKVQGIYFGEWSLAQRLEANNASDFNINSNSSYKLNLQSNGAVTTFGGNVGIGITAPNDLFSFSGSGVAAPAGSDGTGHNNTMGYLTTDDYALVNYGIVKSLISTATSSMVTIARFVGATTVSVAGNNGIYGTGYTNANNICNNATYGYLGSHVCTSFEVLNTIASGVAMPANDVWIFAGPPAYTWSANDCEGRTTAVAGPTSYGAYWQAPNASYPQGRGLLGSCSAAVKLACCR